jgi:hypothetical protein
VAVSEKVAASHVRGRRFLLSSTRRQYAVSRSCCQNGPEIPGSGARRDRAANVGETGLLQVRGRSLSQSAAAWGTWADDANTLGGGGSSGCALLYRPEVAGSIGIDILGFSSEARRVMQNHIEQGVVHF